MTNPTFFKTKEQYFQFRTNFAAASRNVKSKSTTEACDEWLSHEQDISYNTGRSRVQGWLKAEHFIFLNIIRGKPYHHGFTPVTSKNKLTNGANSWQGLDVGVYRLQCAIHSAKDIKGMPKNTGTTFKEFIAPLVGGEEFLNVALMNILCEMDSALEGHTKYYSYFGEGKKIAEKMVAEDLKPKNYEEFMKIAEEIDNAH